MMQQVAHDRGYPRVDGESGLEEHRYRSYQLPILLCSVLGLDQLFYQYLGMVLYLFLAKVIDRER